MKMDKEFVTKHKFWLLLGAGAAFMLIAIFFLFVVVPRATAKIRADVEKKWKDFKTAGEVKNEKFVEKAKKAADVEEKKKVEVWEYASKIQQPLFPWPTAVEKTYAFARGNRANEIVIQAKDKKLAELPEDDVEPLSGTHLFHGNLVARDADWIEVEGRPRKASKDTKAQKRKFYRTPKVKILASEEKDKGLEFSQLTDHVGALVAVKYDRGIYSYDDLTDREQDLFRTSYKTQILDVLKTAGPVNEVGDVLVQFKEWPWRKGTKPPPKDAPFFRWVETWTTELATGGTLDLSEEAWLAQEDLWIYRELFRLVKQANDYVAQFEPSSAPAKGKSDPSKFQGDNPYWHVEASVLGGGKVKILLKNKLDRMQGLGVRFTVQLTKNGPYVLLPAINSVSLLPAGTKRTWMEEDEDTKKTVTDPSLTRDTYQGELELPGPAQGIYGFRQVLTWETAAVRRIDQINIGTNGGNEWALSHRLADKPLVPFRKVEGSTTPDLKDDKQPPGPRVVGRGGVSGPQGNAAVNRTPNGLVRDRYLEKTPQARRVPVAIALIVDQAHVARVQVSFANSPLRFLTGQITVQRYPGSLRPPDDTQLVAEGKGGVAPQGPGRPVYYQGPGRPGLGRFGERGLGPMPVAGGAGAPSTAAGADEQESNVELVLYGVVSIYERFPPPRRDAQGK